MKKIKFKFFACAFFALFFVGQSFALPTVTSSTYELCDEANDVSDEDPLTVSFVTCEISCYKANDGCINLSIEGKYDKVEWNDSRYNGNMNLQLLSPGTYTVTVTNERWPQADQVIVEQVILTQPERLEVNVVQSEGNLKPIITGGTAPYGYYWYKEGSSTRISTEEMTDADVGTYVLWISDANGCETSTKVEVAPPLPPPAPVNDTLYVDLLQCGQTVPVDLLANDQINDGMLAMESGRVTNENSQFLYKIPCFAQGVTEVIPYELQRDGNRYRANLLVIAIAGCLEGNVAFLLNPEVRPADGCEEEVEVEPEVTVSIACTDDRIERECGSHTELKYYLNDQYSHPDKAFMQIVSQPTRGKAVLDKNKLYYVAPTDGGSGDVSFRYSVCSEDKTVCDTATMVVALTCTDKESIADATSPCSELNDNMPIPQGYKSWCHYWSEYYPNLIVTRDGYDCVDICGNKHHDDAPGDKVRTIGKVQRQSDDEEF